MAWFRDECVLRFRAPSLNVRNAFADQALSSLRP